MFGCNACAWGRGHFDRRRIKRFIVAEFLAEVEPRKRKDGKAAMLPTSAKKPRD